MIINCGQCKKDFKVPKSRFLIAKFCSKSCYSKSQITEVTKNCPSCKKEFITFMSRDKYGRGKYCSKQCQYIEQSKDKCHLWKGGVTPIQNQIRQSKEYKLWRKAVFARDNYTCVVCKATKCELNADHIKPFAFFPELRFAIDNGATLCVPCHKKTPTYGEGAKKMYKHLVT